MESITAFAGRTRCLDRLDIGILSTGRESLAFQLFEKQAMARESNVQV